MKNGKNDNHKFIESKPKVDDINKRLTNLELDLQNYNEILQMLSNDITKTLTMMSYIFNLFVQNDDQN